MGQLVQTWSAQVSGEVVGTGLQFDMAFSNIDQSAPDGLMGDTDIEIQLSVQ